MAYSTKLCLPLKTPCFVSKTVRSKTLMVQQSQVQVKVKQVKVSQPQPIRYYTKNTTRHKGSSVTHVTGGVICEGYDEGPRCPTQSPMVASYSREVEILSTKKLSGVDRCKERWSKTDNCFTTRVNDDQMEQL